ncbi:MAG: helix-turn-helix domain-containing protein [Rhodothermales bacterium]
MKFTAPLDNQTREQLRLLMHTSPNARVRQRAHAVLLSSKRYRIDQIADIFEVDRDTVSRWLSNWHERGFEGLSDEAHPGRPRTLDPEQEDRARAIALCAGVESDRASVVED